MADAQECLKMVLRRGRCFGHQRTYKGAEGAEGTEEERKRGAAADAAKTSERVGR